MLSIDDEHPPFAFVLIEGSAIVSELSPAELLPSPRKRVNFSVSFAVDHVEKSRGRDTCSFTKTTHEHEYTLQSFPSHSVCSEPLAQKKFLKFFFLFRVNLLSKVVHFDELNHVSQALLARHREIRERNSSSAWTLRRAKPQHLWI
jgi:hypothetical protein